jgi:hypothetical protein
MKEHPKRDNLMQIKMLSQTSVLQTTTRIDLSLLMNPHARASNTVVAHIEYERLSLSQCPSPRKAVTNSAHANKAATIAKTPAPANVLSELAPPVGEADALLAERVAEFKAADEPELALPVKVAVPVEVIVIMEPLEDMVEVTVEAVAETKLATLDIMNTNCTHT